METKTFKLYNIYIYMVAFKCMCYTQESGKLNKDMKSQ